jgi:protein-tyrosine phosphatase
LPPRARDLIWDGCLNVRDLGGFAVDSGETRFGSVVRADSVSNLTPEGWKALADYGVRTVIDLRGDHEREDDSPRNLPVEVLHVPFMEASEQEWDEIAEELEAVAKQPRVADATRDAYLIFLERFRTNVGAAVKAVAHAPEGGLVIHCVGGKDRTGLLSALLLYLAGVPVEEIAADYALSEERLRPRHDKWFEAAETDAERERLERISRCPPEAIVEVFAELERRYGSIEGYLRAAGVSDEELELARSRLR